MKYFVMIGAVILFAAMTFGFGHSMAAQRTLDNQDEGAVMDGDDSNPSGPPEVQIPARYQPQPGAAAAGSNVATLYFTPQDTNTNTTVIFLYNTGTVTATVGLETFQIDGSQEIPYTSVSVPPGELVRICADQVSGVVPSWDATIYINFRDFSAYAKMSLPAEVHADAYVVWNGGTTYDPEQIAPTLPIRFSSDPFTTHLPAILDD